MVDFVDIVNVVGPDVDIRTGPRHILATGANNQKEVYVGMSGGKLHTDADSPVRHTVTDMRNHERVLWKAVLSSQEP